MNTHAIFPWSLQSILRAALPAVASLTFGSTTLQAGGLVAADQSPTVITTLGTVRGLSTATGEAFLGLPYATPPVGALRWHAPQAAPAWTGVLDAVKGSPRCPQGADPTWVGGGLGEADVTGAEDCLYLNIYRPAGTTSQASLPVMVWIHGGAFVNGSGIAYDGGKLARNHDVIVVTLNYRVGALGFLAHPALDEGEVSGNYGLQDQRLALQWVHEHIAAFGGDPAKVTIFGESAGGQSVCNLLVAADTAGLFRGAIIQSGPCGGSKATRRRQRVEQAGVDFAKTLGCTASSDAACLRAISAEKLVVEGTNQKRAWAPVYGDGMLPLEPDEAFTTGRFNRVPTMIGTTHDEARLFSLLDSYVSDKPLSEEAYEARVWGLFGPLAPIVLSTYPASAYPVPGLAASAIATDAGIACQSYAFSSSLAALMPTYSYEFNDQQALTSLRLTRSVPALGAFHSSEITYIFQSQWLVADPAEFTAEQQGLADQMAAYWANFAKSGSPNAAGLPDWRADSEDARFVLSLTPGQVGAANFSDDHHCDLWRSR